MGYDRSRHVSKTDYDIWVATQGSEYIRSIVRQGTITPEAAKRLRWFEYYGRCGNARRTCRYFGISAQTFYRWKRRFDPYDLTTLEEESRRPVHVRSPLTPAPVVDRILKLRLQYPRWGKDKLVVLLRREGIRVSTSTVGRVLKRLKDRGVLVEPLNVRLARAALIRKVYEVDPMLCPNSEASSRTAKRCPKCGSTMKVIAFITDYAVVDRIINHLKLTFISDKPPPSRIAHQELLMAADPPVEYFP